MQIGFNNSYSVDGTGALTANENNYSGYAGQDSYKRSFTGKRDSVEISSEAYRMQADEKELRATSGKDYLGISRGSRENCFVIHFSDSAMVNRAVKRGYITVNGVNISLTDDLKKKLTNTDREAQSKREAAFMKYGSDFNIAVAKQQSEALSNAYKDMTKGMKVAMKLLSGKKVSKEELNLLMKTNPELYDMIMALRQINKNKEKRESATEQESYESENTGESGKGVSLDDFEWKTYETCLDISLEGEVTVGDVSIEEVILN